MATVVILQFHPQECANPFLPHGDDPFEGITVLGLEEATPGSDYMDIIGPEAAEHPRAQYAILEVK